MDSHILKSHIYITEYIGVSLPTVIFIRTYAYFDVALSLLSSLRYKVYQLRRTRDPRDSERSRNPYKYAHCT